MLKITILLYSIGIILANCFTLIFSLDKNFVKEFVNLKAKLPNLKRLKIDNINGFAEIKEFMRS